MTPVNQARENRRQKLEGWFAGGNGNRWPGDDGRFLRMEEYAFWPQEIKDAESSYFSVIDAEYEAAKAAL